MNTIYFFNIRLVHEVTDEDMAVLRSMTGTPISYIVSEPPLKIRIENTDYPIGSGLSYQVQNKQATY